MFGGFWNWSQAFAKRISNFHGNRFNSTFGPWTWWWFGAGLWQWVYHMTQSVSKKSPDPRSVAPGSSRQWFGSWITTLTARSKTSRDALRKTSLRRPEVSVFVFFFRWDALSHKNMSWCRTIFLWCIEISGTSGFSERWISIGSRSAGVKVCARVLTNI